MIGELDFSGSDVAAHAISPARELGAYEALWEEKGASFKSLAQRFAARPGSVPSDFVPEKTALQASDFVRQRFKAAGVENFGVRIQGTGDYPQKLRDADHPVAMLYYRGDWTLTETRSVAVVGTRKPTEEGAARTRRMVRELVRDGFTIVSGLAAGIDSIAHRTAIEEGGRTTAVIGTPLSHTYPKSNSDLQQQIARDFLVVSQVPLKRYESQDYRLNRLFFPERNVTMSALTEATIIVEAGETSGTLIQARAALKQRRKLFILESCFRNPHLTWPHKFAELGAIRVREYDDIRQSLLNATH